MHENLEDFDHLNNCYKCQCKWSHCKCNPVAGECVGHEVNEFGDVITQVKFNTKFEPPRRPENFTFRNSASFDDASMTPAGLIKINTKYTMDIRDCDDLILWLQRAKEFYQYTVVMERFQK